MHPECPREDDPVAANAPVPPPLIDRIVLRQGAALGAPSLHFAPGPVTVLVGPNNSGKSLLLREIERALAPEELRTAIRNEVQANQAPGAQVVHVRQQLMRKERETLVLDQIRLRPTFETFARFAREALYVRVVPFRDAPPLGTGNGQKALGTEFVFESDIQNNAVSEAHRLLEQFDREGFAPGLMMGSLIRVDGRKRFELVRNQERGDLHSAAPLDNSLRRLLDDDSARERLRAEVLRAFPGVHVVVDGTRGAELRFGVNPEAPPGPAVELGSDAAARDYHARTTPLSEASDGVNAFVALVAVLLSGPYEVMLVDEPEAYLPAPRQRQLGRLLSDLATERGGHVIVSTHSPAFLEGCLERNAETLHVVRLTYDGTAGTARLLAGEDLKRLALEPLLRNTAALDGLFRDAVVVTEDHNDRVVYQEISRRLADHHLPSGAAGAPAGGVPAPDTLFVSAENKSTLSFIAGPLRRLGVPAIVVADLDLIHGVLAASAGPQNAHYWTRELPRTLRASGADDAEIVRLVGNAQGVVEAYIRAGVARGEIKKRGLAALAGQDLATASALLLDLAAYGVFLVPVGELERWGLAGATNKGREWVEKAFEALGSVPGDAVYQTGPATVSAERRDPASDIWTFVAQIKGWGAHPSRGLEPVETPEPLGPRYRPELAALHSEKVEAEVEAIRVADRELRAQVGTHDNRPVPNAVPPVGDWFAADPEQLAERDRQRDALDAFNRGSAEMNAATES